MKRIGILSDTHGIFDQPLRKFFEDVDELWHAGDFGSIETADAIAATTKGGREATFLSLETADAIAQKYPVYESGEIPAVRVP